MSVFHSQRKLSNISVTREFHFQHMGLWIVLTMCFVVLLNVLLYLLLQERWARLSAPEGVGGAGFETIRGALLTAQAIQIILMGVGVVALAKFTSHRIAGPFIRLRRAFNEVRDGDLDHLLKFRKYDRLTMLEDSFNGMMESLRERIRNAGHPDAK